MVTGIEGEATKTGARSLELPEDTGKPVGGVGQAELLGQWLGQLRPMV